MMKLVKSPEPEANGSSDTQKSIGERQNKVTAFWLNFDWSELIERKRRDFRLTPEAVEDDGEIYDWIDALADNMGVDFVDASSWVLWRVLGDQLEVARRMNANQAPWDPDVQYACRAIALQACRCFGPCDIHPMTVVDGMVEALLSSDEELLFCARTANAVPC